MAEMERRLAARGCLKSYLLATPRMLRLLRSTNALQLAGDKMVLMGKELQ
jgi:hypothetical protein